MFTGCIHGTAKQANIISVKVLDQETSSRVSWIIGGFEWISNHINQTAHLNAKSVINLSWSIFDTSGRYDYLDDIIRQIPAVSVASAGNDDQNAYSYVPARFSSVITVGATNAYDGLTWYTNYGSCVDILAPGDAIVSASHKDNTSEVKMDGTSTSAPFVSGNYVS